VSLMESYEDADLTALIQEAKGANVVRGIISFIITLVMGLIVTFKFLATTDTMGLTGTGNETYQAFKATIYLVFGLLGIFLLAVGAGVVMSAI